MPIRAVSMDRQIQVVDQLCTRRQAGRGIMPNQSYFHWTPTGSDAKLVALNTADTRQERDLVYYLQHILDVMSVAR